jgi:hypothetical protein
MKLLCSGMIPHTGAPGATPGICWPPAANIWK